MGAAKGSVPWNAGKGTGWTDPRNTDLLAACKQSAAELLIAASLIAEPATDPIAWIDGVRDRLTAAIAKAEGR